VANDETAAKRGVEPDVEWKCPSRAGCLAGEGKACEVLHTLFPEPLITLSA